MKRPGANSLLRRYCDGDRERVWSDMLSLGAEIRSTAYWEEAQSVGHETMKRALDNVERLIDRLTALGYKFFAPDRPGVQWMGPMGPILSTPDFLRHSRPTQDSLTDIAEVERCFGTLPLSLKSWYEMVGGVNLTGDHPKLAGYLGKRPESKGEIVYPDPLEIFPPGFQFQVRGEEGKKLREGPALHPADRDPVNLYVSSEPRAKAGYGAGLFYEMQVPDARADGALLRDSHGVTFLGYLRFSFRWGGFPGWEKYEDRPSKELAYLSDGLLSI